MSDGCELQLQGELAYEILNDLQWTEDGSEERHKATRCAGPP